MPQRYGCELKPWGGGGGGGRGERKNEQVRSRISISETSLSALLLRKVDVSNTFICLLHLTEFASVDESFATGPSLSSCSRPSLFCYL